MSRKRSTPWIHRWSRPLMGAVAIAGALLTGYLTVVKVLGGTAACPTEGCDRVLSSPYAMVFGLPLTLFGSLAYLAMAVLALGPLLINPRESKGLRTRLERQTGLLLFIGATAMVIFSGYLMYLLAFEIKALCIYCLASALFSASLFLLAVLGRSWDDAGQLLFTGIVVGMVTLIGTLGVYASVDPPSVTTTGETGPAITTESGPAELALAEHLTAIGAKKYGAYWCPHCHDQKQLFGREAFQKVNYIECDPGGQNPQPDLCQAAKIEGYPTWEINGKLYSGVQSLERLAALSDYQGPHNFTQAGSER